MLVGIIAKMKNHNSFNTTDEIQVYIEELSKKYPSKSAMFNDVFEQLLKKQINLNENSIKESQEVAKLDNLKLNHTFMKSKILNTNADTELKKSIIAEYIHRGLPIPKPLQLEKEKIDNETSQNPLYPKGLMCIDCGIIFECRMESLDDRKQCREMYVNHIVKKHKRLKFRIEEEVKIFEFTEELNIAN